MFLPKHLEFRQKLFAVDFIFNSLQFSVFKYPDEILSLVFDILEEQLTTSHSKVAREQAHLFGYVGYRGQRSRFTGSRFFIAFDRDTRSKQVSLLAG